MQKFLNSQNSQKISQHLHLFFMLNPLIAARLFNYVIEDMHKKTYFPNTVNDTNVSYSKSDCFCLKKK